MFAALALAVVVLAPQGPPDLEVPSPDFAKDLTILRGTSSGLTRSDDGGSSWTPIELPGSGPVNTIVFEDGYSGGGYVLVLRGGNTAAMSRNGRSGFEALPVPPGGRLNDLLLGSGFGLRGAMTLARGTEGVWSSDDFGQTWEPDGQGLPPDIEAMELSSKRNAEGHVVQSVLLARSGAYRRVGGGAWERTDTIETPGDGTDGDSNRIGLSIGAMVAVGIAVFVLVVSLAGRRRRTAS